MMSKHKERPIRKGEAVKFGIKIIAAVLVFLLTQSLALSVLKKGDKFYPFSLRSVDGKTVTVILEENKLTVIAESMEGGNKVIKKSHPDAVLLDFWATWCVPCRAAMPYMQKMYEKYKPEEGRDGGGLELFGIAIDKKGSAAVKPFYKKLNITYALLADPGPGPDDGDLIRNTKDMQSRYRVQTIPVVYLIDSKGVVEHVHEGFKKKEIADLENTIKGIIRGAKE